MSVPSSSDGDVSTTPPAASEEVGEDQPAVEISPHEPPLFGDNEIIGTFEHTFLPVPENASAAGLKQEGNDFYRKHKYRDALRCYSLGIRAWHGANPAPVIPADLGDVVQGVPEVSLEGEKKDADDVDEAIHGQLARERSRMMMKEDAESERVLSEPHRKRSRGRGHDSDSDDAEAVESDDGDSEAAKDKATKAKPKDGLPPLRNLSAEEELLLILHSNCAQCYLALQKPSLCLKATEAALKINPRHLKSLYRSALAHEKREEFVSAQSDLSLLLKLEPRHERASLLMMRVQPLAAEEQKAQMKKMWGELKKLGTSILGKFGIDLSGLKVQKGPGGGYNISMGGGGGGGGGE